MSNQKKKTIYRHPVTNKFISKREWEELQKTEVEDNIEPSSSDFDLDPVYIQNTQKLLDSCNITFDFSSNAPKNQKTIVRFCRGGVFFPACFEDPLDTPFGGAGKGLT
mgnify:CR=1 FL=1